MLCYDAHPMHPQKKSHITIIGAGLSGCFLAILLAKRNYKVTIYEKLSRKETLGVSKRSINISFHNYTADALKKVGVWKEVKTGILPLEGSVTRLPFYKPIYASFANLHLDYFSARREKLLHALINKAATYANITFAFDTAVISVDKYEKKIVLQNLRSKKYKTVETDLLIGADGVNSTVRAFLQQGQHTLHSQNQVGWEYKQIAFSIETANKLQLDNKRAYSSTRKNAIFVALPNKDKTFNGMLAMPRVHGFTHLKTDAAMHTFLAKNFPELLPVSTEIIADLKKNPTGKFVTLKTFPWVYKDFMALVGDAAHSVTPFIGHGVTVGLGDCMTLISYIDRFGDDWKNVLAHYQMYRKKNADVLVDMSLESFSNFKRERKANYNLIYARLESELHRLFPTIFSASTFERIVFDPDRAAEYMQKHKKQRRLFTYLGVPVLVSVTTAAILMIEKLQQFATQEKKQLFPLFQRDNLSLR